MRNPNAEEIKELKEMVYKVKMLDMELKRLTVDAETRITELKYNCGVALNCLLDEEKMIWVSSDEKKPIVTEKEDG